MLPLTMDFGILNALILPLPGMGVVVGETGDAFLDVATLQWLEFRADMVEETSQLCLRLALEEGQRVKSLWAFPQLEDFTLRKKFLRDHRPRDILFDSEGIWFSYKLLGQWCPS